MATRVWLGGAVDIAQVDTVTVGGTWVQGDLAILEIGDNDLVVTVGSSTNTASVATAISVAVNGTSKTDSLDNDETRNVGGQQIPEFTEVTSSVSGSVVTLEGNTRGVPFTLTASPSSAAGTLVETTPTAATGKNFFDSTENWSGNTVPVTGDTIVFQNNEVDCLYGLSQAAVTNVSLQIDASYTGNIGLSPYNDTGYDEYRVQHLTIKFSNAERSIVIGEGTGSGSSRLRIDASTSDPKMVIASTGPAEANSRGAVDFIGGNTDTDISIRQGSLSIASDSSNSATVSVLEITYENQRVADVEVNVGENTVVRDLTKDGGTVTLLNTSNGSDVTVTNREGLLEFNGRGDCTIMTIEGGEVRWHSTGTLGTASIKGSGILDFSRDLRTKTVTNPIERYSDASRIFDPNKVVSSLVIDNNQITDLSNLDLGTNIRITRGTPA